MRRMLRNWRAVSVLGAVFMFVSCASTGEDAWVDLRPDPSGSGPIDQISGTVHYLDLEGGLYVIQDARGTSYNPTNLPEAFQVEGMAVEADVRRRDDVVSTGMVGPVVELLRIRRRPGGDVKANRLMGTEWRLEDLAGTGVMDIVQATLAFTEEGTVSGNGSCNQFHGSVTVSGAAITFGPLATTRKMCPEAVMNQETRYLEALNEADRFEIEGPFLTIHAANLPQPLRFIGADEMDEE